VGTVRAGKLRNQALLKFDGGWMELFSAASKDAYGRREVGIALGNSTSTDQTTLAGTAIVQEVARPESTIPLSYTCVTGPQPYTDFFLGDSITVLDIDPGVRTSVSYTWMRLARQSSEVMIKGASAARLARQSAETVVAGTSSARLARQSVEVVITN